MNKQEVIKILESKVVRSEENLKHFPKESQGYAANEARIIAYNIAITQLEQIEEPKPEKVVVKPFVVDWYEVNKEDLEGNIFTITIDIYDKGAQTEFEKWFNANDTKAVETLIKMKLFGYTAEQPKRWVVRQGGSEVWCLQGFRNSLDGDIVKQWCSHEGCIKFTDKAKAAAVAVLVEGTVEEV